MKNEIKQSVTIALLGVVLGLLIALSVSSYAGWRRKGAIKAEYAKWQKLNVILKEIDDKYVDTVDVKKLTDVAVTSVLGALDPHSVYLPPKDLEKAENELADKFCGIGIMFNVPNDTAVVLDVVSGGPAEKVGMVTGDKIIEVDGKNIAGVNFPQDSMVLCMKGPLNSKVRVTVRRDAELIDFDITRGVIPVHSVDVAYMLNDTTGYLKLSKFAASTFLEVLTAADSLRNSGMKHMIFDLRDNSGGYFSQALLLSNLFLKKGEEIVYLEGRHGTGEVHRSDGKGPFQDMGLTLLINENSASSSEIFAGAIQDNDRGLIVGRRSFGKGLVQAPIYFSDGSGIRLTISRFHTPSGRCIQKPYDSEYIYDIYKRYADGEMFDRDSIKVDTSLVYKTAKGRTVYGGGGIIPDVFVPIDTANVTEFSIRCNKKAVQMRFASVICDKYKGRLTDIDNFEDLDRFLDSIDLPKQFLHYATVNQGVELLPGEWAKSGKFLVPQVRGLVGRYSKLGESAFFRYTQKIDPVIIKAAEL